MVQNTGAGLTGRLPSNVFLSGHYLILRKVGQGGMAAVYQATDTSQPGTLWAIKEMSDAALSSLQERAYAVQTFQQEANLLRMLDHPNLPKVVDAFTEGGKHYLVMEFVPGHTLQNMLEGRSVPFTEAEVLPWALQLCDVLGYLHSQTPKIIFRDLKPSNIMLTPQGQIKLIDFGIVRFFKPGKTKDTVALGTPGYVAPEAVGGQTDERSDLYSLCMTLHQLLTLNDPLKSMFNPPPVRRLNSSVSAEMERILERGLQNHRELRWPNASEMRQGLVTPGKPYFVRGLPGTMSPSVGPDSQASPQVQWQAGAPSAGLQGTVAVPPAASNVPGPRPPAPLVTSRPTTRLLMVAVQLTGRQLAGLGLAIIAALVIGAWLLAPVLAKLPFDWNNVPVIGIFGALGYAAYPRRGVVFASHVVLSTVLVVTIWARMGAPFPWSSLILALLLSGAFMEIWAAFLPKIKGDRPDSEAWKREAAWLVIMEMVGAVLFFGLVSHWITGYLPLQWLLGAIFGLIGWFLGDFVRQYLLYRRTGVRRR